MKIWVTKYLFTAGIETCEAEVSGTMATEHNATKSFTSRRHFHGNDWHRSEAAAQAHALVMIAKQRNAIANRLRKVDDLEAKLRRTMRGL